MKRLFTLICASTCLTTLIAQDVIYTTAGDSIVAKVETISEEDITYHRYDNPAGPLYTIRLNNISSIRYANGSEDVFTLHTDLLDLQQGNTPSFVTRRIDEFYYEGTHMNVREYREFLEDHCPIAYENISSGGNIAAAGWICLTTSAVFGVFGLTVGSLYLDVAATLLELAAIPLIIVGHVRMYKSVSIYNIQCNTTEPQPYLSFQASDNGFGLALRF